MSNNISEIPNNDIINHRASVCISLIPTQQALVSLFMVYNDYMSCSTCSSDSPIIIGAEPQNVKWNIVRGDDVSAKFEWYEDDGVTLKNTTGWTYAASAYDPKTSTKYTLTTTSGSGYVTVSIASAMTGGWGVGSTNLVAELIFDLQVTIDSKKWTPVIGTIAVRSDITGSTL